jgi:hypothetical protein
MDTVVHFLHVERTKLREAAVDRAASAADAAAAAAPGGGSSSSRNGQGAAAVGGGSSSDVGQQAAGAAAGSGGLQLDYQRKVTPSERAVLLADVLDDAFEAAAAAAAAAGERRAEDRVKREVSVMLPKTAAIAHCMVWCCLVASGVLDVCK